ncbi:MAG: glycosyltransferase family 1 protein [Frankiales bacterium]|nr:MAG: glycosyltransferase family 1 protein [Frankiales bacterium]
MRLAVVLEQCLAPVPGGTGRYSREVAAALARCASPDDEVSSVVAWHRSTTVAAVAGVRGPRRLPLPRRALVAAWERGRGPRVPGDAVLAPTPLFPPAGGAPCAVVVHDAVPWTHPETLTPRGVAWHRSQVERAAREAALVVVPTQAVAEELRRRTPLRELLVVGEGVTGDLALPADAASRAARLGLPASYLLTVATLEPRKGLDVLLSALARPEAPDLPLLCVGQPGWGGLDPVALAAAAGLGPDRVRVLGRVPDADLAVLLDRATALVVPSRAEGFGLPLLEAMAAGTPVVTSDAAALVEVGAGAARVSALEPAALAAALAEVAGDAELRARMAEAGRLRAAAYSWDAAAGALWSALRDIASPRSA